VCVSDALSVKLFTNLTLIINMTKTMKIGVVSVVAITGLALAVMAFVPLVTNAGVKGNGAPSGPHYNLNIIGVSKDKTADMTGNNGHRIFVKLDGKTRILLTEGEDYQVLDANGTDGTASFQLPNPDPDNDGVTVYSVYARALGTPGGSGKITTCAWDPVAEEEICSIYTLELERTKGKQSFENVSKQLLYIYADIGDGLQRYNLFHSDLQDYFWSYDNNGLKVLQLRFYEVPTDVN